MNFKDWNWHRTIRIFLGAIFAFMAYTENQTIFLVIAVFLFYQAALNIKCLGSLVPSQTCNQNK
ncbi:MAG: hypothetical protein ACPGVH_07220 [Chitinophagales bacterium]